jgi:[protein-PII] uridylyltransferase
MISSRSTLDLPIVAIRHSPRLGSNVFLVYAPDSPHLLADIAGGFEQAQLNIVDAKVHGSSSGFALYTFTALESDEEHSTDKQYLERLCERLRNTILMPSETRTGRNIHIQRALKHFPIDTRVRFSQHNDQYTVMEVIAQDQPGLLHKVALCLQKNRVLLVSARIATFGERAEDVFFITDRDGNLVDDIQLQEDLTGDICGSLNVGQPESVHEEVAEAGNG